MGIRLIYHTAKSAAGGISPFDQAIKKLVDGSELLIACPYLSLSQLQNLTSLVESWRVLTDVEEWLLSHNQKERNRIQEFIERHAEQVHHLFVLYFESMKTQRIYIDTSVIGGCQDDEFAAWSNGLMKDFRLGNFKPVLSRTVALEIVVLPKKSDVPTPSC